MQRFIFNPDWREIQGKPIGAWALCVAEEWDAARPLSKFRRDWIWYGELVSMIEGVLPDFDFEQTAALVHLLELCGVIERISESNRPLAQQH
jgi:hypothetical protein